MTRSDEVLAALMDSGPKGAWANALLARHPISAPHHMPAERTWELGTHVSSSDAWYVALAEALDVPLVTLDLRLAKAHGLRCTLWTPATG